MFQYNKNYPKYPFCLFYKTSAPCGAFGIRNAIAAAIVPTNPNSDNFLFIAKFCIFVKQNLSK